MAVFTQSQLYLASVFIQIYYRDRQSLVFSILFPLIFMGIFLFSDGEPNRINIGLVNQSQNELSVQFSESLKKKEIFLVQEGAQDVLKESLLAGDIIALIIIPKVFNESDIGPVSYTHLTLPTNRDV